MTNYNERLDEILDWGQAARAEADIVIRGLDTSNGSYVQERLGEIRLSHKNKAKQAFTSLIKELVAEAKPEKRITEADKLRSQGRRIVGSSPFVDAENDAFNDSIDQFEQNLLKALEEV